VTAGSVLIARGRYRFGLVAGCRPPDKTLTFPRLCGRREPNPLGSVIGQDHEGTETMDMKKLVATVALAGAVTVGTAGAAFAADSSGSGSTDPSAQTGKGHPGLRREVRRAAVKVITDTLGVSREDLRAALKGGQTVSQYATSLGKDPQAVRDALVNAANTKLDQLVADGKLQQDRADTIKGKVPGRVDTLMNRQFGQHAPVAPQS
jgi:hypothetical protein